MEGSGSRPDTQGLPFRTIVEQRKAKMNILDLAGISKMKTTVMSAVKKSAGGMTMSATPARLDNGPLVSFLIPALPSAAEDDNPQSTQPKTDIGNGDLLAASSVRSKSVRARRRPISSTAESSMADDTGDSLTSNETMLRRIYNDVNSDEQHGEPIDGVATLHALRLFGFKISEKELWDMLREIDVNEAPKPTTSALGFPQMLEFDFDLDLLDVVGVGQLRQAAAATELEEKLRERRVLFEDFKQLVFLWQSSAQFQLFEERDAETAQRVAEATRTRMLATDGPRMWCWQVAMLMTTTYLVMVAVAIFTNRDVEMAQYFALYTPLDALVTGVLLADIVLKFRCCRVSMVERSPVLLDDAWSVARDYMGSWWFVVDMVTLLPWRFVCFAGGSTTYLMRYDNVTGVLVDAGESGCVGCTTVGDYQARVAGATFLLIVRALKFVEHVRYFEETGLSPVTRWYIFRQFVMGHVFVQLARFGVIVHTLSVIYLSLERWSRGAESADGLSGGVTRYAEAMYLTLYCMATVGYGDIVPKSDAQRVYLMFLCATGWLFSAYVIGSLIGFFQASDIETGRQTTLLELSTLLSYFDVPEPLVLEILSFENYILQNSLVKSFDRVVSDLPADMQRNLELWTRIKIVNRLPLFCDYHRSAKLQICRALVEMTFCPEDYVYLIGEVGEEMFFVNHGFIDILDHDSACEATKRAGDYFGELAAFQLTPSVRANDAKCLSYCEVFVLGREELTEVRKQYPRVQRAIDGYLTKMVEGEKSKLDLAMTVRGVFNVLSPMLPVIETTPGDNEDRPEPVNDVSPAVISDGQFALGFEPQPNNALPSHSSFTSLSARQPLSEGGRFQDSERANSSETTFSAHDHDHHFPCEDVPALELPLHSLEKSPKANAAEAVQRSEEFKSPILSRAVSSDKLMESETVVAAAAVAAGPQRTVSGVLRGISNHGSSASDQSPPCPNVDRVSSAPRLTGLASGMNSVQMTSLEGPTLIKKKMRARSRSALDDILTSATFSPNQSNLESHIESTLSQTDLRRALVLSPMMPLHLTSTAGAAENVSNGGTGVEDWDALRSELTRMGLPSVVALALTLLEDAVDTERVLAEFKQ